MTQKQQDRIPYIPSNGRRPTLEHIWDMTFAEMRDDAIRIVDAAIDVMEPLQRRDFECAAKYDELLLLRKKAEAMPKNYDEAITALASTKTLEELYNKAFVETPDHETLDALMIPLSISEHQLHAFVKWLDKESERKWSTRDANIEIANQTNLWKKYNIDKSFDTPPSEEYCQAMWGVSSIEELHARAREGR